MLKSDRFDDFAGLEAFDADADPFRGTVDNSPDRPEVGKKTTGIHTGYLLADAAFFLG